VTPSRIGGRSLRPSNYVGIFRNLSLSESEVDVVSRVACLIMSLDFDAIRANAANDGIDLAGVAIIYEGLTSEELAQMRAVGRIARETEQTVLGKFAGDGTVMFPDKAIRVIYLGA
jgi:hypothetical protein